MELNALGMIETCGLVAAVEAADAALKAATVKLIGYQKVRGGLILVAVTGDVAAVQAAVNAGTAAAAKVGKVISQHVIPRPIEDIKILFADNMMDTPTEPPDPGEGDPPQGQGEPPQGQEKASGGKNGPAQGEEDPSQVSEPLTMEYLKTLSVMKLRRLARKTPGLTIHGRQISKANKQQLLNEFLRVIEKGEIIEKGEFDNKS